MWLNKKSICTGHSGTSDPITYETEPNQKQTNKTNNSKNLKTVWYKNGKMGDIICIN